MTKNSLLPDYKNSGGKGKSKTVGSKKLGRPRTKKEVTGEGIPITEDIISDESYELYYNGYNGVNKLTRDNVVELEKFKIFTDFGIYTPDFLLLKIIDNMISKILIIETKSEILAQEDSFIQKQNYVKEYFLEDAENKKHFDYIKIGDILEDKVEYNKLRAKIKSFMIDK